MRVLGFLLIVIFLVCASVQGLSFCADVNVKNNVTQESYLGSLCTVQFDGQTIIRVELNVVDQIKEVAIYWLNRPIEFKQVSSKLSFSLPWTPQQRTCCRHRYVEDSEESQLLQTTDHVGLLPWSLMRNDGFNWIYITGNFQYPSDLNQFKNNLLSDWDNADNLCPLQCKALADVIMLVDASGSIDNSPSVANGTNWRLMREFIREFANRFTISPQYVRMGLTYFAGYRTCSNNNCQADDFCLPISGLTRTTVQAMWNNATTNPAWFSPINWLNPSTTASQYSCWSGTTNNAGYSSVELYVTDNSTLLDKAITRLNNNRAYVSPFIQYTGIGSGITLSKQLFDRTVSRDPTTPKILVVLTDGQNNCGESPTVAANMARSAGIDLFVVGIGDSVNQNQLLTIAGGNSGRVFNTNFNDFANVLDPIISGTCTGQNNGVKSCENCNRLCTLCGDCISCKSSSECSPCRFCSDYTCVTDTQYADSYCAYQIPPLTECQLPKCNPQASSRQNMCILDRNEQVIAELGSHCPNTFNETLCRCPLTTTTSTTGSPSTSTGGVTTGTTGLPTSSTGNPSTSTSGSPSTSTGGVTTSTSGSPTSSTGNPSTSTSGSPSTSTGGVTTGTTGTTGSPTTGNPTTGNPSTSTSGSPSTSTGGVTTSTSGETTSSTTSEPPGNPPDDDDDDDSPPWWIPLVAVLSCCCCCCCLLPLLALLALLGVPPLLLLCCCLCLPLLLLPFFPILALILLGLLLFVIVIVLCVKQSPANIQPLAENGPVMGANVIENPLAVDAAVEGVNSLYV